MAESVGFEPKVGVTAYGNLANCWFKPTHPKSPKSAFQKTFVESLQDKSLIHVD